MTVHIRDDDRFKEGDDDETHGASEGVKHTQPVLTGARTEDKTNQQTGEAHTPWRRRRRRKKVLQIRLTGVVIHLSINKIKCRKVEGNI